MVLEKIKRKHWKQLQKEVVAATWGAIVYHRWKARNWAIFKQQIVHTGTVIPQIKKELTERLDTIKSSRRVHRCQVLVQRFLCN